MKNKQKGFIVPVLLGIIALLIIGGGIYIYHIKNSGTLNSTDTETQALNQLAPVTEQNGTTNANQQTTAQTPNAAVVNPPANGSFSASPITGAAPLTVQFSNTIQSAGDTSIDYGDGTSCTTANPDGSEHCSLYNHTYVSAGTYTATLYRHLPTTELARTTVTVTSNGSASTVSVPGMAQYTDPNFGFSFWYPNTWTVQDGSSQKSYLAMSGGTIVKSIMVGPSGDSSNSILVQEFASPSMSITDSSDCGPADGCPTSLTYRFDPSIHSLLAQSTMYGGSMTTKALTTFTNTMGGLHLLGGNARFRDDYIIPLSAEDFLIISSVEAGTIQESSLAQTVTATDPSVATPISHVEQTQAIQAEQNAYVGDNTLSSTVWQTYTNNQYGFSLQYPSGYSIKEKFISFPAIFIIATIQIHSV